MTVALAAMVGLATVSTGCRDDHQTRQIGWRISATKAGKAEASKASNYLKKLIKERSNAVWQRNVNGGPILWAQLAARVGSPPGASTVARLSALEHSPGPDPQERRRLRYLRLGLLRAQLDAGSVRERDAWEKVLFGTTSRTASVGEQRGLYGLAEVLAGTDQVKDRSALNRAQRSRLSRAAALIRRVDTSERVTAHRLGVDLQRLAEAKVETTTAEQLARVKRMLADQSQLFATVWKTTVQTAAVDPAGVTLADLDFLQNGAMLRHMLPATVQLGALRLLTRGLGIPFEQTGGLSRLQPGVVTAVSAPQVPHDVRLSYGLRPGLLSAVALFEAAGRAICARANRASAWELRDLGQCHGEQTLGYLLGQVWLESTWWDALGRAGVAQVTGEQIQDLLRYRILMSLVRLRIDGLAMPVIRVVRRGGHRNTFAAVWDRQWELADLVTEGQPMLSPKLTLSGLFAGLLGRYVDSALAKDISPLWVHRTVGMRPRHGVDPWVLALMLGKRLRREHGPKWFDQEKAGHYLVSLLCSRGRGRTALDLARETGQGRLRYDQATDTLRRRWQAIDDVPAAAPPADSAP